MLWSRALRALVQLGCLSFVLFCSTAAPASEGDSAETASPSTIARLDSAFGDWVVDPMAALMFKDIYFWDDTLPAGEGVGSQVGDEDVVGWEDGAYELRARKDVPVADVVPVLDPPVEKMYGPIKAHIRTVDGALTGHVAEQSIELERFGLERVDAVGNPEDAVVTVDTDLPFELKIDRIRGVALETEFSFPTGAVQLTEGMQAELDGERFDVLAARGDTLTLRALDGRRSAERLANPDNIAIPAVVAWLVFGAVFFTFRMAFINLRGIFHSVAVTMGKYDDPNDPGEISHFQALTSALSATVGLGNIAGVALAIGAGGPGAVFWMVMAAFFGMSSKFTECTLGQMYRERRADGSVSGGPMHYLDKGLAEMGFGPLGKVLAGIFALLCIGGSLGGGNMFQANQSFAAVQSVVPLFQGRAWLYGLVLAFFVGLVIIGGIRRIGTATSVIVPVMCAVYILAGVWVLLVNADQVPTAFATIFQQAFRPDAMAGGFVGVMVTGFQRAAFSNEAGVGSASIAHSAASTAYPVREGIVALLEPFIDTIVVCTMTGLVVVVTGTYKDASTGGFDQGVLMTSNAFATVIDWFPLVLTFAVVMFAYSTMISWSYYGERCATWLFGEGAKLPYRMLFLAFVWFGSVFQLGNVLTFSDLAVLGMAFPNILGALFLSGKVKRALDSYWSDLKAGRLQPTEARAAASTGA